MREKIVGLIQEVTGKEYDVSVEPSEDLAFGHYATSVALKLASASGKNPRAFAEELAVKLRAADRGALFERIEVAGPGFINFWLSKEAIRGAFLEIVNAGKKWGTQKVVSYKSLVVSKRPVIIIDYSHPNIAKPMSVAHLRSTIIGAALYNVFKFSGWKTIGDNHLGDWGKQFGVLIAAYKEKSKLRKDINISELMRLYVDYTARMKEDPKLEDVAREETKKLQDGDKENVKIWKAFYKISINEFQKIYKILGVKFDYFLGESFYKPMLGDVVKEALAKGIAKRSEGAVIIPLDPLPPFVIQKSDEAFLYSTTDLAAVQYRVKKFKPNVILYVVDNGQSLHFEQLFVSVRKLGFATNEELVHAKFGLILSEDMKKLSTRAGRHIALEAVIDQAIEKARALVDAKRNDLSEAERAKIAQAVGIAALKYNDLSQNRQSDIAFRWKKMLNLEGNSAPYLIYTYVRLKSILRKGKKQKTLKADAPIEPADLKLVLKLMQFPDAIARVRETYFPHLLTDYLYDLAKCANHYYQSVPVLKSAGELQSVRLHLVSAVAETMKIGLGLLGISALQKM